MAKGVQPHSEHENEGAQELAYELLHTWRARPTAEVFGADEGESSSSKGRAHELEDGVGQAPTEAAPCDSVADVNANAHRRIQATPRDGARPVDSRNKNETDGEAEILILLLNVFLGCSDIHDHEAEQECVENLTTASGHPTKILGRPQAEGVPEEPGKGERCQDASCHLHAAVDAHRLPIQAWPANCLREAQSERNCRVKVGA
mmetsp:Transcript_123512/g.275794  ORF Transcript_123512/g.275794 Transcript_123512/m.275794 type:complete len:204 (-) Transcript_123512:242-853(-)